MVHPHRFRTVLSVAFFSNDYIITCVYIYIIDAIICVIITTITTAGYHFSEESNLLLNFLCDRTLEMMSPCLEKCKLTTKLSSIL